MFCLEQGNHFAVIYDVINSFQKLLHYRCQSTKNNSKNYHLWLHAPPLTKGYRFTSNTSHWLDSMTSCYIECYNHFSKDKHVLTWSHKLSIKIILFYSVLVTRLVYYSTNQVKFCYQTTIWPCNLEVSFHSYIIFMF